MVTGNAQSDRLHSFGHLCRFLYPRTGALSWRYRQSCSKVVSANSDVLGGNDDCSVRTRGCGSSYESNGTSRDSPSDNDARDLWATRVGTVDSFGSPQSCELERNRRDLRDCRSSMDSRRSPRRVSARGPALMFGWVAKPWQLILASGVPHHSFLRVRILTFSSAVYVLFP